MAARRPSLARSIRRIAIVHVSLAVRWKAVTTGLGITAVQLEVVRLRDVELRDVELRDVELRDVELRDVELRDVELRSVRLNSASERLCCDIPLIPLTKLLST